MNHLFKEVKKYWVSWWTREKNPLRISTDFDFWLSGEKGDYPEISYSICAVMHGINENDISYQVKNFFPDRDIRFINEVPKKWNPDPGRFPGYKE